MKIFCPNCEKEQEVELYSEVYECTVCREGFETQTNKRLAEVEAERDEWRQDAERLAKSFVIEVYPHEWVCRSGCHHMGKTPDTIEHSPDCPIKLHRELVAKYEVSMSENNQHNVCNGSEKI